MAVKNFGSIVYNQLSNNWEIVQAQPHVCIKLKNIFPKINKAQSLPFVFNHTPENCHDLIWFMDRYPLSISVANVHKMHEASKAYINLREQLEKILMPDYTPKDIALNDPFKARIYQEKGAEFHSIQKRFLLGDDIGLGKTLTGILTLNTNTLPAIATVQTHLPNQWKLEGIEKFTNLKTHLIQGTKPYNLPKADVYIMKYSCLSGWVDLFQTGFFKSAIFDEVQELRREESQKYQAAKTLSYNVEYCLGMSATPIYNYGDEIFNVLDLINPGCLGLKNDFLREWCTVDGRHYIVDDTKALGTYLREQNLFLRRTREEVGQELPPVNKIVHTVGYDSKEVLKAEQIAYDLALKTKTGSFVERGQAARELDALARHVTGVSKAREVAEFVKILLENGRPVLLAGWHRDVYDIWLEELKAYKPVMYTGTESAKQKDDAKRSFIAGETNLFIISLRSGIGLDGLQKVCSDVVLGELDWSPQVHDQLIGRVDRDGRSIEENVTAYFLVSEFGSDPVMIDILGLKSSQSYGIIDPLKSAKAQHSDSSHISKLAESFLEKRINPTFLH